MTAGPMGLTWIIRQQDAMSSVMGAPPPRNTKRLTTSQIRVTGAVVLEMHATSQQGVQKLPLVNAQLAPVSPTGNAPHF